MKRLRLAVLISGRGSNLRALIAASADSNYPAEIVLVISDRPEATGLAWAASAGIPHSVIPHADREAFARDADMLLRDRHVDLIALAGFMRVLDTSFVERWRDRIMNIHPSLLPSFPGMHAQRQALSAGVAISGCTVHFVRPEVDSGPVIARSIVPVSGDDDEQRLSARILVAEHELYSRVVRLFAEGRLRVIGETVEILEAEKGDA